ncbi:MAG: hypothetical protein ACKVU4_03765 [Phycisphaerales bacterium]
MTTRRRILMHTSLGAGIIVTLATWISIRWHAVYVHHRIMCGITYGQLSISWVPPNNAVQPHWIVGPHPDLFRWWPFWIVNQYSGDIGLPLWPIAVGLLYLPIAIWLIDRRARRAGTRCSCGYDLTGNTTGVCPECGEAVIAEKRTPD